MRESNVTGLNTYYDICDEQTSLLFLQNFGVKFAKTHLHQKNCDACQFHLSVILLFL